MKPKPAVRHRGGRLVRFAESESLTVPIICRDAWLRPGALVQPSSCSAYPDVLWRTGTGMWRNASATQPQVCEEPCQPCSPPMCHHRR